jgi:hypothetical protein
MEKTAPHELLIAPFSSDTFGPIGVGNLLRLWAKVLLDMNGRCVPGQRPFEDELDLHTLDAISVSREEFMAFMKEKRPTYHELEVWLRQHPQYVKVADKSSKTVDQIGSFNSKMLFERFFDDPADEEAFREVFRLQPESPRRLTKLHVEILQSAQMFHKQMVAAE